MFFISIFVHAYTEDTAVRPISGAMAHAIDAIAQLEGGIRLDEYMRR